MAFGKADNFELTAESAEFTQSFSRLAITVATPFLPFLRVFVSLCLPDCIGRQGSNQTKQLILINAKYKPCNSLSLAEFIKKNTQIADT